MIQLVLNRPSDPNDPNSMLVSTPVPARALLDRLLTIVRESTLTLSLESAVLSVIEEVASWDVQGIGGDVVNFEVEQIPVMRLP